MRGVLLHRSQNRVSVGSERRRDVPMAESPRDLVHRDARAELKRRVDVPRSVQVENRLEPAPLHGRPEGARGQEVDRGRPVGSLELGGLRMTDAVGSSASRGDMRLLMASSSTTAQRITEPKRTRICPGPSTEPNGRSQQADTVGLL
jgi:hypothetical protein